MMGKVKVRVLRWEHALFIYGFNICSRLESERFLDHVY